MICMGVLMAAAVTDIRYRRIPVWILILGNVSAIIYQLLWHREDLLLLAGGVMVGGLFFLLSKVTEESIGYADSWGILCLGIYLGLWKLIEVLAGAFFLLALGAIIVLIRKKMKRKTALPFYPFLTAGYVLWMVAETRLL